MLVLIVALSGCASLTHDETRRYAELEASGVKCEKVVSPAGAGALNLLPGFGDIYLATGNYGNGGPSWGAFTLDFLLWVPSVVWAVPQAVVTADIINKKECVYMHSYRSSSNNGTSTNPNQSTTHKLIIPEWMKVDIPKNKGRQ